MERIIEAYFRETCIPLPFEQRQSAYWARRSISYFCYKAIKRLADIVFSLICCLFIAPLALIIKVAYLITGDTASIIYKQRRVGRDGKVFNLYKFRSMVPNAEKELHRLLLTNPKYRTEWIRNQKIDDDPRITKIGKILRRLSLDELPQVINILKNDMSLVGPRPLALGELNLHYGNHAIYESAKPGITGWWAANGRSDIDYANRLRLEYYYIKHQSLSLDIQCILRTFRAVIGGRGSK